MKLSWLFIHFIISPCTAIPNTPKLCIQCKFYIKPLFITNDEFGKCLLFSKQLENNKFIIGKIKNNTEYNYCSTTRKYDFFCGEEGNYYKPINLLSNDDHNQYM